MMFAPMPDLQKQIAADLASQIDQFLSSGGAVEKIANGVGQYSVALKGTSSHHDRLRGERDRLAPTVRKHAEAGMNATEIAKAMKIRVGRAVLIAKENGITLAKST